jgi:hypothetical protein
MVVDDFDIIGMALPPDKAEPPLVVDTDAVLPFAVASQGFQPVARRDSQIPQTPGTVQVEEFSARDPFESPEPGDIDVVEQRFRVAAPKGTDHVFKL